jgi:hypothetical protein
MDFTDRASIVEDFWLAVGRNDRVKAEAAVLRLKAPMVSVSTSYSFEMVKGEEREEGVKQDDTGALMGTPRGVMPDTPTSTVYAWNDNVQVSLVVVNKRETCRARLMDGEVDFLACAGPMEHPGGTGCGFTTHELGGKDSKKQTVIKMDLPKNGDAFTILVKASWNSVKRPKIFSLPILLKTWLPYPETIDWDLPLTSFKFKAREWKYLIKGYNDLEWFVNLSTFPLTTEQLPALEIPSPTMGRGGFPPKDFEAPPNDMQS